jgi:hypothetical protein
MTDSAISSLRHACVPLSAGARTCLAPCAQNGQTVKVQAAAFGIPFAGPVAPEPLGAFQTWIDQSSTPPILRMRIEGEWTALYALEPDGTMLLQAALALPADPALAAQAATKHYVDARFGAVDTLTIRGALDCSGAPDYPAANTGDVYIVSVAGRIGGASGVNVLQAAMLVCMEDGTAPGTQADVGGRWAIVQGRNPAQVKNATSVADADFAQFDAGSGTQVRSSGITLDTDASMAANSDLSVPSQKAVKSALGGKPLGGDVLAQGELLVWDATAASFRAASGGGRNLLVNSAFDLWEEATSYTFSQPNVHIADFWNVAGLASSSKTASRAAGFAGSRFALQIRRTPGSSDTSRMRIGQQFGLEESRFLQGKPLTLSFDVLAGADFSATGILAGLTFGTGIDEAFTLSPVRAGGNSFPTGSGTTLPNVAGIDLSGFLYINTLIAQIPLPGQSARLINRPVTIPANWMPGPVTEVVVVIDIGPFAGQAGADDSLSITNVKLEVGNIATPYVRACPEEEASRCQRRYRKSFERGVQPYAGVGIGTGEHRAPAIVPGTGAQSLGMVRFPAMRAAPNVRLYNPAPGDGSNLARDYTAGDCTATAVQNVTETGFEITAAGNTATAAGNTLGIHWVADARL